MICTAPDVVHPAVPGCDRRTAARITSVAYIRWYASTRSPTRAATRTRSASASVPPWYRKRSRTAISALASGNGTGVPEWPSPGVPGWSSRRKASCWAAHSSVSCRRSASRVIRSANPAASRRWRLAAAGRRAATSAATVTLSSTSR
ncbi:hypothetical protein SANT12839_010150 [Streptomyces antimycoticus]|uniref:Uncharacterized protein n=1 Tax=Streptomyces antimycoticus TaxID=68175 RepID=A0A4D4K2I8_9ACTN|nr:hypothetical protein SANT12839_010150 [Streptomyces antimycoticus]